MRSGRSAARSILLLATSVSVPGAWAAARPPAFIPSDPGQVLERLPAGYAAVGRARPGAATQADVDRMLAMAGRSGDARLVSRAARALDGIAGQDTTAALKARAYIAQYQHDFAAAAAFLDGAIARDPRDGSARLSRAQVHVVTGRLQRAREDCAALLVVDTGAASLCLAALALRQGDHQGAIRLTDGLLRRAPGSAVDRAGAQGTPVALRHLLLLRAEAASRAGAADATGWFDRALAVAPADVRTRAAYARHLRTAGRPADVLAVLRNGPLTDTLRLERVLAAHALGAPDARRLAAAHARRYEAAETLGIEPERREQALFELVVRGDADRALQLALENFHTQRDHEDVEILVRAALAAGDRDALAPLREWAESQDVVLAIPEAG